MGLEKSLDSFLLKADWYLSFNNVYDKPVEGEMVKSVAKAFTGLSQITINATASFEKRDMRLEVPRPKVFSLEVLGCLLPITLYVSCSSSR